MVLLQFLSGLVGDFFHSGWSFGAFMLVFASPIIFMFVVARTVYTWWASK